MAPHSFSGIGSEPYLSASEFRVRVILLLTPVGPDETSTAETLTCRTRPFGPMAFGLAGHFAATSFIELGKGSVDRTDMLASRDSKLLLGANPEVADKVNRTCLLGRAIAGDENISPDRRDDPFFAPRCRTAGYAACCYA